MPFAEVFAALATGESHLLLADGAYFSLQKPELETLRTLIEEARALQEPAARAAADQPVPGRPVGGAGRTRGGRATGRGMAAAGVGPAVARTAGRHDRPAGGPVRHAAALPARGVPVARLPVRPRARRHPRRRHGAREDAADAGADQPRARRRPAGAAVPHRRAHQRRRRTGRPRPRGSRPGSRWCRSPTRCAAAGRTWPRPSRARRSSSPPTRCSGSTRTPTRAPRGPAWCSTRRSSSRTTSRRSTSARGGCPRPFKLAITGTPMENNLMELWSLLSITAPGLFPSPTRFQEHYARPIERKRDAERLARLRRRIRPLVKRRTKEQVAADLPPKQEQVLEVELEPRHRRLYQRLPAAGAAEGARPARRRRAQPLHDPALDHAAAQAQPAPRAGRSGAGSTCGSSKIDTLVEQLGDVIGGGHRALVFSQFTGFLAQVRARLDAERGAPTPTSTAAPATGRASSSGSATARRRCS